MFKYRKGERMKNSILLEKLVNLRKINEFSQAFVAKELNISIKNYMDIENGSLGCNSANLKLLSKLYEIKLESLVDDTVLIEYKKVDTTDSLKLSDINDKLDHKNKTTKIKKISQILAVFFVIVILFSLINKNSKINLTFNSLNSITSSETTVVIIDKDKNLYMSGLNIDSELFSDVVKVKENNDYTITLNKFGVLHYDNEAAKQLIGIEELNSIVDFDIGSNHLVTIDEDGILNCLGDNSFNQCEIGDWYNVNMVVAKNDGTVGITINNTCFATGDILDIEKLVDLDDVMDICFSDNILVYLNIKNQVIPLNDYAKKFDFSNWDDVIDIQCGNDYIAGLTKDGHLRIAVDDYKVIEATNKWNNLVAISGSNNFLVAYDGNEVFGIGENEYNQFVPTTLDEQIPQLSRVNNINVEFGYEFIKVDWDKVDNADYYSVQINVGTGYSTKVSNNSILVDVDKFSNGQEYFIKITSLSNSINYQNSEVIEQPFIYNKKPEPTVEPTIIPTSEPIEIPSLITLEKLTGKTKDNFEIYMKGLGVLRDNLIGTENQENQCIDNIEVVLTVNGVEDSEEITIEELNTRVINYTYCKLIVTTPTPVSTPVPTVTPMPSPEETVETTE
jgi:transcriptional regulator with XRE-family HTH domain